MCPIGSEGRLRMVFRVSGSWAVVKSDWRQVRNEDASAEKAVNQCNKAKELILL